MEKQLNKLKYILDKVIAQAIEARKELEKEESNQITVSNWEPSFPNLDKNLEYVNENLKGVILGGKAIDKVAIDEGLLKVVWK